MSELHATRKRLLDALAGLSKEQWNFKPAPDRWPVVAAPERQVEVQGKDEFVLKTMADRSAKREAGEALRPRGRWGCWTATSGFC